ncbi:hypothetical protein ACFYMB_30750 [Micromonospora haikouensis]
MRDFLTVLDALDTAAGTDAPTCSTGLPRSTPAATALRGQLGTAEGFANTLRAELDDHGHGGPLSEHHRRLASGGLLGPVGGDWHRIPSRDRGGRATTWRSAVTRAAVISSDDNATSSVPRAVFHPPPTSSVPPLAMIGRYPPPTWRARACRPT